MAAVRAYFHAQKTVATVQLTFEVDISIFALQRGTWTEMNELVMIEYYWFFFFNSLCDKWK